jgi:hypothetical protein
MAANSRDLFKMIVCTVGILFCAGDPGLDGDHPLGFAMRKMVMISQQFGGFRAKTQKN